VAQTKNPQPNAARAGMNREQSRRGGAGTAPAAGRGLPLSSGGRGRRIAPLDFIHDVRSELRKVVWPTQRETVNLTVVVLALSLAVGLFLGGTDFVFQELFRWLLGISGSGGA
jgi:preprotein translocase subunit SecE